MKFERVNVVSGHIKRLALPDKSGDGRPNEMRMNLGEIARFDAAGKIVKLPANRLELFPFSSHTFTNAGSTGRFGPSLSQCRSAYSTTNWAKDMQFFSTNGGSQIWTVPDSGTYRIEVIGARGGRPAGFSHFGKGARLVADFELEIGTKLRILVGQVGQDNGGVGTAGSGGGGAGGGASFVQAQNDEFPLILAGGGAGGGNYSDGGNPYIVDARAGDGDPNYEAVCRDGVAGAGGSWFANNAFTNSGLSLQGTAYGGYGTRDGGFGGGGGRGSSVYNQYASGGGGFSGGSESQGRDTYRDGVPYSTSYIGDSGVAVLREDGVGSGNGRVSITKL